MALVAERIHNKHGNSIFIRDGLKVNKIYVCEEDNVELSTVELPGVVVHSMYKLSPQLSTLGQRNKHHIVIGDFSSHNRRRTGGATKEPRTQSSQVVAHNAQQMPHIE